MRYLALILLLLSFPAYASPGAGNVVIIGAATNGHCIESAGGVLVKDAGSVCGSSGGVTSVTGAEPITSTGGSTPVIGFDFTTNNTWSGVNHFTGPLYPDDDIYSSGTHSPSIDATNRFLFTASGNIIDVDFSGDGPNGNASFSMDNAANLYWAGTYSIGVASSDDISWSPGNGSIVINNGISDEFNALSIDSNDRYLYTSASGSGSGSYIDYSGNGWLGGPSSIAIDNSANYPGSVIIGNFIEDTSAIDSLNTNARVLYAWDGATEMVDYNGTGAGISAISFDGSSNVYFTQGLSSNGVNLWSFGSETPGAYTLDLTKSLTITVDGTTYNIATFN